MPQFYLNDLEADKMRGSASKSPTPLSAKGLLKKHSAL